MKTYRPGLPIRDVGLFDYALREGLLLYVKPWNKTAHPIILANMQYRVVKGFIERGDLALAQKIVPKTKEA